VNGGDACVAADGMLIRVLCNRLPLLDCGHDFAVPARGLGISEVNKQSPFFVSCADHVNYNAESAAARWFLRTI
jgi:hypothetical protein